MEVEGRREDLGTLAEELRLRSRVVGGSRKLDRCG